MTTLPEPTGDYAVLTSDLPRDHVAVSEDDIGVVASGIRGFAVDLYGILARQDGNLVFSPASVTIALAMTYAGAAGATATEMAAALRYDLPQERLHSAFNALELLLESRNRESSAEMGGIEFAIANSLWGQQGTPFESDFLDTLARDYGAALRLVDYVTAAEDARAAINGWVAATTNDKITDLIPAGVLDAMTRLVLVNAVYLDATWAIQFDPEATADADFRLLNGSTVSVPTMHQNESLLYTRGDGWKAAALPYVGGKLAMLLLVPDAGRFTEIELLAIDGLLTSAADSVERTQVRLALPKFEFRTQAGLAPMLGELGMREAFDPTLADFSGMTNDERLFISDVIHEAYIAVDEEGTEAAAATAVVMRATSAPMDPATLTIDRPFLFMLYDRDTGTPLFLGRVLDPSA
jgi:serpin B